MLRAAKASSRASKRSSAGSMASRSSRARARSAAAASAGGAAIDEEMRENRGRPLADASGQRRLLGKAGGDLLGRPAGDAEAGRGEDVLDRAADTGRTGAGERPVIGRGDRTAVGGAGDEGAEPDGVAEGAGEPPPPGRVEIERIEHRGEEAEVSDPHYRARDAEERRGIDGESKLVRVGGDRGRCGRGIRLRPEGTRRARRRAGERPDRDRRSRPSVAPGAGGEVMERDGDGEVRPERHLDAVLVGGEEKAAAEILAEQFDEHAGVIDDRRRDEAVAGVGEKRAKGLIGVGHCAGFRLGSRRRARRHSSPLGGGAAVCAGSG